jgi:hypothetical protein
MCNEPIKGRTDKKFCDSYCRNSYNNKLLRISEKKIQDINKILRKNRTILKKFNPEGRTTVRKEFLKLEKFNFNYFTHNYTTKTGNIYHFCYEYGYMQLPNDKVLIVNYQQYMNKGISDDIPDFSNTN